MNIEALLKLYESGQDNVLMRFTLGSAYLKEKQWSEAEAHLRAALAHDPSYSAAWKLLGKALASAERHVEALAVYEEGIGVAEGRGDIQAAKEMRVFAKRSRKVLDQSSA